MNLLQSIKDKVLGQKTVKVKYVSEIARRRYKDNKGLTNVTEGAAGYDVCSNGWSYDKKNKKFFVRLGIHVEIPKGYVLKLYPRSSVATKTTMILCNSVGIIDSDYRGEVSAVFKGEYNQKNIDFLSKGNRIGQFTLEKSRKVNWETSKILSETKRGNGGYGHTSK